jgi:hypothetical protein
VIASGALAFGRALAESLMSDTVRVFRVVTTEDFDPETGEPVTTETDLYTGPGRLVLRSSVVRDVDAAHQLIGLQGPRLDVPVADTGDIRGDDRFVVTASETDDALVGVSGVVKGGHPQTHATARRLPVEVIG